VIGNVCDKWSECAVCMLDIYNSNTPYNKRGRANLNQSDLITTE
jgi:hypothetical protein